MHSSPGLKLFSLVSQRTLNQCRSNCLCDLTYSHDFTPMRKTHNHIAINTCLSESLFIEVLKNSPESLKGWNNFISFEQNSLKLHFQYLLTFSLAERLDSVQLFLPAGSVFCFLLFVFFSLPYPNISNPLKENTTAQNPSVLPLLDPTPAPAEKFIRS